MFYEPLYQKYRPQTFDGLVGQKSIVLTLSNAIRSQRISHAYLFTGPRGTGKTSTARIFAKSINCLASDAPSISPCGNCEACQTINKGSSLDVIEIDAASNTGVDNIREIIEQAKFAPMQLRYKIYIVDECHMLSTAAFNALLKILEEPPKHVIFILATTDPQRVLPTIISRCQRFDYRRIAIEEIVQHLGKIAKEENINIEIDALNLVAKISNGGLRDAESLLDQLSLFTGKINSEKVNDLVGLISERDLLSLLQAIRSNNSKLIIEFCGQLINKGKEPLTILQNIANFHLNLLISKVSPQCPELTMISKDIWKELCIEAEFWKTDRILKNQQKLRNSEIQLKSTTQPYLWIEIILLDLLQEEKEFSIDSNNLDIAAKFSSNKKLVIDDPKIEDQTKGNIKNLVENSNNKKLITDDSRIEDQTKGNIENLVENSNNKKLITDDSRIEDQTKGNIENLVESSSKSSVSTSNADLEGTWNLIIQNLPPFLAGLIKEHGCLVSHKGRTATVGMSSSPLLELTKSKLSEIELAFEKVIGHKVTISLKVETKPKSSQDLLRKSNSDIPNSANNPAKNIIKNKSLNSNNNIQKTNNTEETVLNNNQELSCKSGVGVSTKISKQSFKDPDLIDLPSNGVTQIAKKLATFFKGEIIDNHKNKKDNDSFQDLSISDNSQEKIITNICQDSQVKEEEQYIYETKKPFFSDNIKSEIIDNKELLEQKLQKKLKGDQ
ncbi:DNA polymerase III subunit gamma/tau [Candidatus Atelocyanobacterium thalassae]|uniref:DNA polymerase III subunit gamma/tau n=1 Tax=Candidatus Atelocyanobacterium thalassae TaxID=713887 RepID=UPI0009D71C1D|nr:DNA polymerase III subunit gamma/tau [Candidatus Atelocyanobacterium thalassa]